jgi:hypothetical protein
MPLLAALLLFAAQFPIAEVAANQSLGIHAAGERAIGEEKPGQGKQEAGPEAC